MLAARRIVVPLLLSLALLAGCDGSDQLASSPTSSPTPDAEAAYIDDTLALVADRVEDIRGLDGGDGPAISLIVEDDLAALIDELLAEPDAVEMLAIDTTLYTLLGLIDPDTDLTAITREVSIAGIAGLYRPEIDHLYVRMFGSFSALEESTAAHEYQHYLQDRHFDLDAMLAGANGDQILAVRALVEGEATYIQTAYVNNHFNAAQAFSMGFGGTLAAVEGPQVPTVMVRQAQFFYLEGPRFVSRVLADGTTAKDLFERPPATTEQLLHPDKYYAGEIGLDVGPLFNASAPPDGWTVRTTDVFGEFMLNVWLREIGATRDADTAAAGWNGDIYQLLETSEGAPAFLIRIQWDTPADQREFFDTVTATLSDRFEGLACASCDFPVFIGPGGATGIAQDTSGGRAGVLLVVAPSGEDAATLINAAR